MYFSGQSSKLLNIDFISDLTTGWRLFLIGRLCGEGPDLSLVSGSSLQLQTQMICQAGCVIAVLSIYCVFVYSPTTVSSMLSSSRATHTTTRTSLGEPRL